jgi:hypothetical protein
MALRPPIVCLLPILPAAACDPGGSRPGAAAGSGRADAPP